MHSRRPGRWVGEDPGVGASRQRHRFGSGRAKISSASHLRRALADRCTPLTTLLRDHPLLAAGKVERQGEAASEPPVTAVEKALFRTRLPIKSSLRSGRERRHN